jgi:hypothetical protein
VSVSVYIDDRPADCREDYKEVIGQLGAAPDESRNRFELWTLNRAVVSPVQHLCELLAHLDEMSVRFEDQRHL